jgi:dTDP-4-dehydrorhamnose 3,5-epimerase
VKLRETELPGVFLLDPERHADERGWFVRTYDRDELAAAGLDPGIAQGNLSFNHRRGTLRGLHLQAAPFAEAKLIRVSRGAIFDVVVDVREGSPTRGRHVGVTLTAEAGTQIYVPQGFAHGFQTLEDATEVTYQISAPFSAAHGRGYRYDSPALGIRWPEPVTVISARDRELPPFVLE